MPAQAVYSQVRGLLSHSIDPELSEVTLARLALLVTGIIGAKSAAPAQVAQALHTMALSGAKAESIERRIRRIESDPGVSALCFHSFARERLRLGRPTSLLLIMDPTTKEDELVMLSVSIWYRGRALPIAWSVWAGNTPLKGPGFWDRVAELLNLVESLLPVGVPVTWLADRAFGNHDFTDLVLSHKGWHYIVRIQGRVVCVDRRGRKYRADSLVRLPGQRGKMRAKVFRARRREASIVVYWGRRHARPLCLMSDLPPRWYLILVYRRRYAIEAGFRDCKTHGWRWEQGQVTKQAHVERLLVAMAFATWVTLYAGTQVAAKLLDDVPTAKRHTIPHCGKRSLFTLGIQSLHGTLHGNCPMQFDWQLSDWDAPNWQAQITAHHAHAFLFASRSLS